MTKRTKIAAHPTKLRLRDFEDGGHDESKSDYEKKLVELQLKMLRIQQACYHENKRAVIAFEGWDAAGKGGTIRRLTEKLDPRGYRVHPISAPSKIEQGKHYLFRFWQRLPAPGRIAVFDRSWYGRVLVERVEGFAGKHEWKRAYEEINEFEHLLIDDGVKVVKLFLHISKQEQLERFSERLHNPYKRWKLTHDDLRNRENWDAYEKALEDMFDRTSTKAAPWYVVAGNRKWFGRVRTLEIVTEALSAGLELATPSIDPDLVAAAYDKLGLGEPPKSL